MMATFAASQRLVIRAQINRMESSRAESMCDAGLQRALAELQLLEDGAVDKTQEWALLGNVGEERFRVGRDSFRVQIVDASGQVDLNTATREQLARLPLLEEEVDALLDWRSQDQNPSPNGAKDQFYNALQEPYNTALRPFESVDELLLVKGFTANLIYLPRTDVQSTTTLVQGSDQEPTLYELLSVDQGGPRLSAAGTPKQNANTGQIQNPQIPPAVRTAIQNARPITSYGQMLRLPNVNTTVAQAILDGLSPDGNARAAGKINLNTATEATLNSLPNLQPNAVQAILTRQDSGFTSLGDLTQIPGLNTSAALAQIADSFETSSDTFMVRVLGESGRVRVAREYLVRRTADGLRLLKTFEPPLNDMRPIWKWNDDASTETTLLEASR
jgi:general secretion pathway protein K